MGRVSVRFWCNVVDFGLPISVAIVVLVDVLDALGASNSVFSPYFRWFKARYGILFHHRSDADFVVTRAGEGVGSRCGILDLQEGAPVAFHNQQAPI